MRLFIGISLPDYYQQALEQIRLDWNSRFKSRLSWTRPGNWHLTLKFLGQVEGDAVSQVKDFVSNFRFEDFDLKASGAGFFGSRGQYRVVWLGLDKEVKALEKLAEVIDTNFIEFGFERESRPFKPHLTLARIKDFYPNDPWRELSDKAGTMPWPEFNVKRIVLWQSTLTPEGPRYKAVCRSS